MNEELLLNLKKKLELFLNKILEENMSHKKSILIVLEILNEYNFQNRLIKKGALKRFVIDCSNIDYSIGEKIIEFDNRIK